LAKGHLFIVSGPSGAGKGTLVKELLHRVPDIWVSVSVTTRKPRRQERAGVAYTFVTDDEFDALVNSGALLEWAEVHGNRYGTERGSVAKMIESGKNVILEIDPQGAFQVREKMPESVLVFIAPPSLEALAERLAKRGSESEAEVDIRMRTARHELELVDKYAHVVINDDVERASDELARIIASYTDD
jgi:guanylate kinase